MIQTPRALGEVTVAWLSAALAMTIDAIEVEPIAAGKGFMGQVDDLDVGAAMVLDVILWAS